MIKTFSPSEYVVEPANVQVLRYVKTINIANAPRLNVLPPDNCSDSSIYGETNTFVKGFAVQNAVGITGDVGLVAGFNCSIHTSGNEVSIGASPGSGMSVYEEQPAEIPVTSEEESLQSAGKYLSRGLKCNQLIESLNGVYGNNIPFTSGNGVRVEGSVGRLSITILSDDSIGECNNQ